MSPFFEEPKAEDVLLRLGLAGPAKSGKSFTALCIALGFNPLTDPARKYQVPPLGLNVGVVDTENRSVSKYRKLFRHPSGKGYLFKVHKIARPYTPERYINAIHGAEDEGIDLLIIDSLSHAWAGSGGILDIKDAAASRQAHTNQWTAWRAATPRHNELVDTMIGCNMHLFITLRSKMDYTQEKDPSGKTRIVKLGMDPIQRPGVEYEFDGLLSLDHGHTLITLGDSRIWTLEGREFNKPGSEVTKLIADWLSDDEPHRETAEVRKARLQKGGKT